ncbi:MAG: catalase [Solirubrobacteraceae bacterium]|nr:catalase [Solirubrobacteraceae bacterium]
MTSPDSAELIAALRRTFGEHRGCRPVHAKGIVCTGTFTGHADTARVCRARHLEGEPVTVAARLSNGTGHPDAPDWLRDRRGLATQFRLADDTTTDLVAISHPVYFAREPQDLVDFSRMRLRDYLRAHPYAATAIAIGQTSPPPASYATVAYHAVHAFRLLDAAGRGRWARWHWRPAASAEPLPVADARERSPDYLRDDLAARLASGPVRFELEIELAADGDPVDDATALWEGERDRVAAGILELERLAPELDSGARLLVFDPTNVADGIELSDDPVLRARGGAYQLSARERLRARESL